MALDTRAAGTAAGTAAEMVQRGSHANANANANANEWITITIPYEQYDGTSGFSRRVIVKHNCSGPPLLIMDVTPAYMALVNDGQ